MRSLAAAFLVRILPSLAAPAVPPRYDVPMGRTEHNPLVVRGLGYVVGIHPYQSVIVGRIESAGLGTPEGVTGGVLRDFVLDGDGDVSYNPMNSRADREKYPDGPPGIYLKGLGIRCEGVSVVNVAGPAMIIENVPSDATAGHNWRDPARQPEARVVDGYISSCYEGLVVDSSDAMVRNTVVSGVRGVGIAGGNATTIEGCHTYGCQTGMLLRHTCYLMGNVTECCGVGLVNEGPGSQIVGHRVFGCIETGIDLRQWAMLSNVEIDATRPGSVALKIGPGREARHSVVDVVLGLGPASQDGATGVIVSSDKTDLTIRRSWGGRRTVVIDRPVSNCKLDVCVDGSLVGVDIQALGSNNRIDITARQCREPVRLPRHISPSNVITVNGKPYRGT
jgi:hypothetical protein